MKKIFMIAAVVALASCGTKQAETLNEAENDSLNAVVEQIENLPEEVKNDAELMQQVEKAQKGELSEEEKTTLWKRLKGIGCNVVNGDETLSEGVQNAIDEVRNADAGDIEDAAENTAAAVAGEKAAEKVEKATQKAKEVKEDVEAAKETAKEVKNILLSAKSFRPI